jgi:hypothetical protein
VTVVDRVGSFGNDAEQHRMSPIADSRPHNRSPTFQAPPAHVCGVAGAARVGGLVPFSCLMNTCPCHVLRPHVCHRCVREPISGPSCSTPPASRRDNVGCARSLSFSFSTECAFYMRLILSSHVTMLVSSPLYSGSRALQCLVERLANARQSMRRTDVLRVPFFARFSFLSLSSPLSVVC